MKRFQNHSQAALGIIQTASRKTYIQCVEHLSSDKRGELSGYVFGKHGADIFIPGVGLKVVKGAMGEFKVLSSAANAAAKADKVYVLETAVGTYIKLEEGISLSAAAKLAEVPFDVSKFLEAGKAMDRGGFTKAGRGLMKHGYREGSVHPKPMGNPAQINAHGQKVLEDILNHPEKIIEVKQFRRYGEVVDIYHPVNGGVRFKSDGEFMGFLEPKK